MNISKEYFWRYMLQQPYSRFVWLMWDKPQKQQSACLALDLNGQNYLWILSKFALFFCIVAEDLIPRLWMIMFYDVHCAFLLFIFFRLLYPQLCVGCGRNYMHAYVQSCMYYNCAICRDFGPYKDICSNKSLHVFVTNLYINIKTTC